MCSSDLKKTYAMALQHSVKDNREVEGCWATTYTHSLTHSLTHTNTHTYIHTVYTLILYVHSQTHTYIHVHTQTNMDTLPRTQYVHIQTHTYQHAHPHTCTHIQTRVQAHSSQDGTHAVKLQRNGTALLTNTCTTHTIQQGKHMQNTRPKSNLSQSQHS